MRIRPPTRRVLNYTEWCKRLRQRLRPYGAIAALDACIQIVSQCSERSRKEELESAPWLTLLIAKRVLEDDAITLNICRSCPTQVIEELRNELWHVSSIRSNDTDTGVFLMLRALIHTQLQLQQPESFSFVRWPALIATLPPQHAVRGLFQDAFGCDPDTFIGVVYAAYAAVLQGNKFISHDFFEPLRPIFGSAIDAFLNRFSRDAFALRRELRAELHERIYEIRDGHRALRHDASQRPESERIEFPWLSKYPLYRDPSGRLTVWHRLVFARGMEDAVHRELSGHGQHYTDPFSRVFESYVIDLVRSTGLAFHSENEIKAGVSSRPAVEALIPLDGCNVLVESKMSLFPDQVLISDRGATVFMKLKRVREAMMQGWRVGELLRDGSVNIENTSLASVDFLIVVTSRQLNLCSGEHFTRLFGEDFVNRVNPEGRFICPSPDQIQRLPLKNIFILSIGEFEHLTGAVKDGVVDLRTLLRQAAEENGDPKTSSMHFDQILGRYSSVGPLLS
jgi:hypothetical protein